jgi:autotransporter-associated beta strand protein
MKEMNLWHTTPCAAHHTDNSNQRSAPFLQVAGAVLVAVGLLLPASSVAQTTIISDTFDGSAQTGTAAPLAFIVNTANDPVPGPATGTLVGNSSNNGTTPGSLVLSQAGAVPSGAQNWDLDSSFSFGASAGTAFNFGPSIAGKKWALTFTARTTGSTAVDKFYVAVSETNQILGEANFKIGWQMAVGSATAAGQGIKLITNNTKVNWPDAATPASGTVARTYKLTVDETVNPPTFTAEVNGTNFLGTNVVLSAFNSTNRYLVFNVFDRANPLSNNGQIDDVSLTIPDVNSVTWRGDGGADQWNTSSLNWSNPVAGVVTNYMDGDQVVFDDTAISPTVNLAGTVQPQSMLVNSGGSYIFNGGNIGGSGGLTKQGAGTATFSGVNLSYAGQTVIENGGIQISSAANLTLTGLSGAGALTKQGTGKLTIAGANTLSGSVAIQGGTLEVLTTAAGAAYSVNAGATLQVTDGGGSTTLGAASLSLASGATLSLNDGAVSSLVPLINAPNFTNAGTVTVTYTATTIAPGAIVLIDYDAANSVLGAFTLNPLPAGYSGSIVTNVGNSSIDLVITGVPAKVWAGGNNSSPGFSENLWDVATTANWNGGAATYAEGDLVRFDDTGVNTSPINVNGFPVLPSLVYVTNSSVAYSFTGGTISTPLLVKEGSGTMSLQAAGNNFTGIDLRAGTLSYEATATEAGAISGDGTLRVDGSASLTLSGNNSGFDGPINVVSGSTLTLGANNVLGTTNGATTIASGATLNVGNTINQTEQIIVSGAGVDSFSGAIVNNSTATQLNSLSKVRLTDNTTFGGTGRWDIRAVDTNNLARLDLDGPYTLTKVGANIVALVDVEVDPQLGDINVEGGQFRIEGRTSANLGNLANKIRLNTMGTPATLGIWNAAADLVPVWNKNIELVNGDATIFKEGNQPAALAGTVDLSFYTLTLNCTQGGLTFSNALTSAGPGSGNVVKIGGNAVSLLGANTYGGTTTVSNGTLSVATRAAVAGEAGEHVVRAGATLGAVVRAAGQSLTVPKLVLGDEFNVVAGVVNVTFNLGTLGNPTAPVINVTGADQFLPYCVSNRFNVVANLENLNTGTITLLDYTGTPVTNNIVLGTLPVGVVATLVHDTANTRFQLSITEVARTVTWAGDKGSAWDITTTSNWLSGAAETDYREKGLGDRVTFNDSASNFVVNLTTTLSPQALTVNASNNYSFSGAGGLAGPVQLNKNGTGTLVVNTVNAHTGGVSLGGGVVQVGGDSALGAPEGGLFYAGGTLRITESLTNARPLTASAQSFTEVATNKVALFGGTYGYSAGTSQQRKTGPGTLIMTNSGTWRLFVDDGTVVLAGQASMTNVAAFTSVGSSSNVNAVLELRDNASLRSADDFNIGDAGGGTGTLRVQDNAALYLDEFFVGKLATTNTFTVGNVIQSGGLITNTVVGGDNWLLGGNNAASSNASASYVMSGGVLEASRNFIIGGLARPPCIRPAAR